jgi:hypothetical protein
MVLVPKRVVFLTHLEPVSSSKQRMEVYFQPVIGLRATVAVHHDLETDSWGWQIQYLFSETTRDSLSSFAEAVDDCEAEIRRKLFGIPNIFERFLKSISPNLYSDTVRQRYDRLLYELEAA